MAARQATLFGENVEKAPFFKTTSSPYYNVINALWQLEDTDDREKFLKSAQTRWMEVYREDEAARKELFEKARKERALISSVPVCLVEYLFLFVVLYTCLSPFLGQFCLKHPYTFKSVNQAVTH